MCHILALHLMCLAFCALIHEIGPIIIILRNLYVDLWPLVTIFFAHQTSAVA